MRDLEILTTGVNEAAAPIIMDMGEWLAQDVLEKEHEAAVLFAGRRNGIASRFVA